VPHEASYGATSLAERKKAVITALDSFVSIPAKYGKPVVTQKLMPSETCAEFMRSGGVPMYDSPHQSVLAMYALTRYARIKSRP
jgi:acyl-CoA synthetase (NDP forming)